MTNIIELFEITMDSIFFSGYTQQLADNEPAVYEWDLNAFKNNY